MAATCKPPYCTCGEHILADDPGPPTIDWCYLPNCTKHNSPTGPPKRIEPTWGELIEHADKLAHWRFRNSPPIHIDQEVDILHLLEHSTTYEEYQASYRLAEVAGLCWWSMEKGEYIWKK